MQIHHLPAIVVAIAVSAGCGSSSESERKGQGDASKVTAAAPVAKADPEDALVKAATDAIKKGAFDKLAALHVPADSAACTSSATFRGDLERALQKSQKKFPTCTAMGFDKATRLKVKRLPLKAEEPLKGCTAFTRTMDLQVFYTLADKSVAYIYLDDVSRDANGRLWLGDDVWCRKVKKLPSLVIGAVRTFVDEACACKDAACFEAAAKPADTPLKVALGMALKKGMEDERLLAETKRFGACRDKLGAKP